MREITLHLKEVDIRIIIALVRTEAARCRDKISRDRRPESAPPFWQEHVDQLDALNDSLVNQSRLTA